MEKSLAMAAASMPPTFTTCRTCRTNASTDGSGSVVSQKLIMKTPKAPPDRATPRMTESGVHRAFGTSACAPLCDTITGFVLARSTSSDVGSETCDKSGMIPSAFNRSTPSWPTFVSPVHVRSMAPPHARQPTSSGGGSGRQESVESWQGEFVP